MFWSRKKESDAILFSREIFDEREKARQSDKEAAMIESAALRTLNLYGIEAVEQFQKELEQIRKYNNV